ncbi:MAG: hypothetical protein PVF43_11590, partial [Candidatus Eiseniibacteriota bacterium]
YAHVYERYPDTEYGVYAGVRTGARDPDSLSILVGRIKLREARADSLVRALAVADSLRLAQSMADSLAALAAADSLAAGVADSLAAGAADSLAGLATADSTGATTAGAAVLEAATDSLSPRIDPVPGAGDRTQALERLDAMRDSLRQAARARRDSVLRRDASSPDS